MTQIKSSYVQTDALTLTNDDATKTSTLYSNGNGLIEGINHLEISDTLIVNKLFLDGNGKLEIDEVGEGGEIKIGAINKGKITVTDITKSKESRIDLGDIDIDNDKSKTLALSVIRADEYISYTFCEKGFLYIVSANHGGPHTGLIYLEPDRDKGKISASMIQGGWYADDDTDHYQIMAEPCNSSGGTITDHNWKDESYKGMRLYLNKIDPSYNTGDDSVGGVKTETVNGSSGSQWWRVWKLPICFNISGFANISGFPQS